MYSSSLSVASGPAVSSIIEDLLEMQIFKTCLPIESENLMVEPGHEVSTLSW